jgi:hypothetical protein
MILVLQDSVQVRMLVLNATCPASGCLYALGSAMHMCWHRLQPSSIQMPWQGVV